jgi:hypothetical protein
MNESRPGRLRQARWEADRHSAVLDEALAEWRALPTVPALATIESDAHLRQLTDQILFRFMKLQDTLGERLVPATLDALAEPFEDRPMRDRIDRLEKLGYLNVEAWLRWRELRNRLAHEYPDAPALREAQLLAAISGAAEMLCAYREWAARLTGG